MKKLLITLFGICALLLTACSGSTPNKDGTSSSTSNNSTTQEIIWSRDVDQKGRQVLGDYFVQLPVYDAKAYTGQILSNESGDSFLNINVFTDDYLTSESTYSVILKLSGFSVAKDEENGFYQGAKQVSSREILVVNFMLEIGETYGYLVLISFLYDATTPDWPTEAVKQVLGEDIPHPEAEYYQYQIYEYKTGNYLIMVACYGLEQSYVQTYIAMLEEAGYSIEQIDTGYYATNEENNFEIDFYYDTDNNFLYVQAYISQSANQDWPTDTLKQIIGMDLPKYEAKGVAYTAKFLQLGEGDEARYVYAIYCDYAQSGSDAVYGQQLIDAGWVLDEETDLDPEEYGHFYYYNKGSDTNEHYVQVVYYEEYVCLLIVVYY